MIGDVLVQNLDFHNLPAGTGPDVVVLDHGPTGGPGAQRVQVVARARHSPQRPQLIRARAGVPLRLVFDRKDNSSCSEEVVFPDFGVRKFLPTGEKTTIEITPPKAGRYEFMCGMSMLRGTLIAEE